MRRTSAKRPARVRPADWTNVEFRPASGPPVASGAGWRAVMPESDQAKVGAPGDNDEGRGPGDNDEGRGPRRQRHNRRRREGRLRSGEPGWGRVWISRSEERRAGKE